MGDGRNHGCRVDAATSKVIPLPCRDSSQFSPARRRSFAVAWIYASANSVRQRHNDRRLNGPVGEASAVELSVG
jgi:hypothetical protein